MKKNLVFALFVAIALCFAVLRPTPTSANAAAPPDLDHAKLAAMVGQVIHGGSMIGVHQISPTQAEIYFTGGVSPSHGLFPSSGISVVYLTNKNDETKNGWYLYFPGTAEGPVRIK